MLVSGWRRVAAAAIALTVLSATAGCSTGAGAVVQGGTFQFVVPGGKVNIFFDPPADRGQPGQVSGPDLMDGGRTVSLDDFAGKVVYLFFFQSW